MALRTLEDGKFACCKHCAEDESHGMELVNNHEVDCSLCADEAIDEDHIQNQIEWSTKTFGPEPRLKPLIEHIRLELQEIEAAPEDLEEWVDVIILALDGAWRAGHSPREIIAAIKAKQRKNEEREWPDWRSWPKDKPIVHMQKLDEQIDKLHGPGAAAAIDRALADGSIFGEEFNPHDDATPMSGESAIQYKECKHERAIHVSKGMWLCRACGAAVDGKDL